MRSVACGSWCAAYGSTSIPEPVQQPSTNPPNDSVSLHTEVSPAPVDRPALLSWERSSTAAVSPAPMRGYLAGLALAVGDAAAIGVAIESVVWVRWSVDRSFDHPEFYAKLWPLIPFFLMSFALAGLYRRMLSPADELRRLTTTTTLAYLGLGTVTFLLHGVEQYSRGVFLAAWLVSVVTVPLMRAWTRHLFCRARWWGVPTLVLGAGATGAIIIRALQKHPGLGLVPVAVLDDDPRKHGTLHDVPVLGGLDLTPSVAKRMGIRHAILAMPGADPQRLRSLEMEVEDCLPHLYLVPSLCLYASLWVQTRNMGGILGLEVNRSLLLPGPRNLKRFLDLMLTLLIGIIALPLCLLIALAIRLDSPGPALYSQERLGRGQRRFRAWKFRSMVRDADQALRDYLEKHPELQAEWNETHKLRNDPRITRVGRWLRSTSLDELPQLWNIVRSDMSLVGPRPIVDAEIPRYAEAYALYTKVRPGLTGMWQVSGRSDTSYDERVMLDSFYVRNWSPWLDLQILAKTVLVVLKRDGAY
jgi:Undecaprenyl-phosphate galactose phosphotransferase WbaP